MSDGQVLEFSGVTKQYGKVTAVSDFTARIEPGRITGFLGPNGAGKTTTLRILLGLTKATSGTATIGGSAYRDLKHPLQTVGGALEANTFHPGRTAYNHLKVYAVAGGVPLSRIDEVLEGVGLTHAAHRKVGGFSLGMRQRLGLATALLGDPGVLVLDEPANGLDPEGIKWMRSFLRDRAREGRTVFVSSHLLGEIQQMADAVIIIAQGKKVFDGDFSDLIEIDATETVTVDSPDRAALARALRDAGLQADVLRSGLTVRGATTAEIGAAAAAAGVVLSSLGKRGPSIEEIFLDLVSGARVQQALAEPVAAEVAEAEVVEGAAEAVEGAAEADAVLDAAAEPAVADAEAAGLAGVAAAVVATDAAELDSADEAVIDSAIADTGKDTEAMPTVASDAEVVADALDEANGEDDESESDSLSDEAAGSESEDESHDDDESDDDDDESDDDDDESDDDDDDDESDDDDDDEDDESDDDDDDESDGESGEDDDNPEHEDAAPVESPASAWVAAAESLDEPAAGDETPETSSEQDTTDEGGTEEAGTEEDRVDETDEEGGREGSAHEDNVGDDSNAQGAADETSEAEDSDADESTVDEPAHHDAGEYTSFDDLLQGDESLHDTLGGPAHAADDSDELPASAWAPILSPWAPRTEPISVAEVAEASESSDAEQAPEAGHQPEWAAPSEAEHEHEHHAEHDEHQQAEHEHADQHDSQGAANEAAPNDEIPSNDDAPNDEASPHEGTSDEGDNGHQSQWAPPAAEAAPVDPAVADAIAEAMDPESWTTENPFAALLEREGVTEIPVSQNPDEDPDAFVDEGAADTVATSVITVSVSEPRTFTASIPVFASPEPTDSDSDSDEQPANDSDESTDDTDDPALSSFDDRGAWERRTDRTPADDAADEFFRSVGLHQTPDSESADSDSPQEGGTAE
ncbi:hypothetical protein GCM10009860_22090 [Microbacterium mitrae]|uniref:ATP-binding cassette domain-containing protein n=1 Tax=Microbacterium mitrae TaxID=664640 RepID=UPI001C9C2FA0|nr:ATP-binding cassette domain-containing protein [Microbacterium mitrae]